MLPKAQWGEYENAAPVERLDLAGEVARWGGVRTAAELVPVDRAVTPGVTDSRRPPPPAWPTGSPIGWTSSAIVPRPRPSWTTRRRPGGRLEESAVGSRGGPSSWGKLVGQGVLVFSAADHRRSRPGSP